MGFRREFLFSKSSDEENIIKITKHAKSLVVIGQAGGVIAVFGLAVDLY